MNNDDTLIDLPELLKQTGLKEPYIRKCLREFKPFLMPYMERGDNNRILFSSNATAIFIKIRDEKKKGFNLSTIRKRMFPKEEPTSSNTDINQDKEVVERADKPGQTEDNVDIIMELKDELHKTELEKKEVEYQHELLKNNIKALPGGSPEQLNKNFQRLLELSTTLEIQTRGLFGRKKNEELWNEVKQILKGEKINTKA